MLQIVELIFNTNLGLILSVILSSFAPFYLRANFKKNGTFLVAVPILNVFELIIFVKLKNDTTKGINFEITNTEAYLGIIFFLCSILTSIYLLKILPEFRSQIALLQLSPSLIFGVMTWLPVIFMKGFQ